MATQADELLRWLLLSQRFAVLRVSSVGTALIRATGDHSVTDTRTSGKNCVM